MKILDIDLRQFREEHDLTQTDMAIECSVGIETYRRWEIGVASPNEKNMKKLQEVISKYEN